jgi:hypothetical protein
MAEYDASNRKQRRPNMSDKFRIVARAFLWVFLSVVASTWGISSCGSDSKTVKCNDTCDDQCVDLQTDPFHCGQCDVSCGGNGSCVDGQCKCTKTGCSGTGVLCDIGLCKTCFDLAADKDNCGACGHACTGTNSKCVSGVCQCNPVKCSPGEVICPDGDCEVCAMLSTSLDHCGACGNKCPTNGDCVFGVCQCPENTVNCGDACADLASDPNHCGACGRRCPTGASCVSGVCQCPANTVDCGSACAVLATNLEHCGACGKACDAKFGVCESGVCGCQSSLLVCGDRCVDPAVDPDNCGGCGNGCKSTEHCVSGVCQCRPGLTPCNGTCVDTKSNDRNCGQCGNICPGAGGAGNFCAGGVCVASCPSGYSACNPDNRSCMSALDMAVSPIHCGHCSQACRLGEVCAVGNCERFSIGRTCQSCPCIDCAADELCCSYPGTVQVICVSGATSCP